MLTYQLEERGKLPVYVFLYNKIKEDILNGRIQTGEKLPSKRSLAAHNKVSVITVENAYAQLLLEGYIYSIEKKGYYAARAERPMAVPSKTVKKTEPKELVPEIDLTSNRICTERFPFTVWSRLMRKTLSEEDKTLLLKAPMRGIYRLRQAIARHLYSFRGMEVSPDQIIVGAGTEYLYELLIKILGMHKIYGVENPGYQKITQVYESCGVTCAQVAMDQEGISVERLRETRADVMHVSPSHHFPTGIVMPIARRQELLDWAYESGERYIIEDDYDSEFRMHGRPIPSLWENDIRGKVIYINTFSKSIAPSIRISYMILPKELNRILEEQLGFYSSTVPSFEQYTLAEFMEQGYYERHINRMRKYYRSQRNHLIGEIRQSSWGDQAVIEEENAGLHFLLSMKRPWMDEEIRSRLEKSGIRAAFLSDYYAPGTVMGQGTPLIINYSGLTEEDIEKVVESLGTIYKEK